MPDNSREQFVSVERVNDRSSIAHCNILSTGFSSVINVAKSEQTGCVAEYNGVAAARYQPPQQPRRCSDQRASVNNSLRKRGFPSLLGAAPRSDSRARGVTGLCNIMRLVMALQLFTGVSARRHHARYPGESGISSKDHLQPLALVGVLDTQLMCPQAILL